MKLNPLVPRSLLLVSFVALIACGGKHTAAETAKSPPPATFAEQVALGKTLYGEECASCHGSTGKNGGAPKVVGLAEGALPLDPPAGAKLRTSQFRTVSDVAEMVVRTMPPGKAGSLTEEQYFAILAFDLEANGVHLEQRLDAPLAKTLVIPR